MAETTAQRRSTARSDIGQFAQVPLWLILSGVSGEAIRLFALIAAKHADHTKTATEEAKGFTRKDLAADLGKSVDAVDRYKAELIKAKALTIEEQHHKGARLADIFYLWYADPSAPTRDEKDPETGDEQTFENASEGGRKSAGTQPHGCDHGGRKSAAPLKEPELLPEGELPNGSSLRASENQIDSDVVRLCEVFEQLLVADGTPRELASSKSTSDRWRDAARLMLVKDGRDPHEAELLLRWSQHDPFWQSRTGSMVSFRANYDAMRKQKQANPVKAGELAQLPIAAPEIVETLIDDEWQRIRELFASEVDAEVEATWISQLTPVGIDEGDTLWLKGSPRAISWMQLRYVRPLAQCAQRVNLSVKAIAFLPQSEQVAA